MGRKLMMVRLIFSFLYMTCLFYLVLSIPNLFDLCSFLIHLHLPFSLPVPRNQTSFIPSQPSNILIYHCIADGKSPNRFNFVYLFPPGAWETKVSNREKKQQRRKDPVSGDSGSPGGAEAPKSNAEALVATAPTNTKKNKGNHGT